MNRITRYQGAIYKDHHILLIMHRHHESGRAYWAFPGGGIEDGETEEECVIREMKEETHLDVRIESLLVHEPGHPDGIYKFRKTYLCTPIGGEAKPGYEPEADAAAAYAITAVRWFDLRDPASWDTIILDDPYTYPQMLNFQKLLGYGYGPSEFDS